VSAFKHSGVLGSPSAGKDVDVRKMNMENECDGKPKHKVLQKEDCVRFLDCSRRRACSWTHEEVSTVGQSDDVSILFDLPEDKSFVPRLVDASSEEA
jgi:hypothetical protein